MHGKDYLNYYQNRSFNAGKCMIPNPIVRLMMRAKIPMVWGKKFVNLGLEEKLSIDFADRLRELTLQKRLRCTFVHLPNEGKRSRLVAIILKAMGMIPGAGDYALSWKDGSGYIELKIKPNKQTDNQKDFEYWCHYNGVGYLVAYNIEDAMKIVSSWGLIIPPFDDTVNRFGNLYELD